MNQETRLVYFHSIVKFIMNYAHYTGGALKITGVDSNNPFCVFSNHPPEMEISPSDNMGLIFIDNNAASAGDDIYGGSLDQALAYQDKNYTMPCIEVIRQSSNFTNRGNNMSSISSKPSRVCLCTCNSSKSLTDSKPNCLQWNSTMEAYPGEDIILSVVAVGQTFGTSSGFVYAQLLKTKNSGTINDTQKYQMVDQYHCNDVIYSIYSHPGHVVLVLTTTSELIQHFGNSEEIQESIDQYNKDHHSYVPKLLLNIPQLERMGSNHTQQVCVKAKKLIGLIYRNFYNHIPQNMLLKLYKSLVRPQLEYAAIWCPHLQCDKQLLERFEILILHCAWLLSAGILATWNYWT